MVRVLDLHLCDSGSNPTFGTSFFFFFVFFFFFFACHEFVTIVLKGLSIKKLQFHRKLHFDIPSIRLSKLGGFSLTRAHNWRVIIVFLCVCVCVGTGVQIPAVMGTWNFPGCKFPGHVSLKPAKGPGGTLGAHTRQLRGMVRLLRVPSPAPGVCEHWLTVPA